MKNEIKQRKFFSAMAFYAILFLSIALIVSFIARKLGSDGSDVFTKIASVIQSIASALAYICACISAFGYVRAKRNIVYLILYLIACVLIAVFVILPIFGL